MLSRLIKIYRGQSEDVKGLVNGVFWSVFGSLVSKALMFLAWILMARILGKELYGEYGIIRNTILMFSTFAGFGMGLTSTKYVAEYLGVNLQKAGRIASLTMSFSLILGGAVSLFVLFFAESIAVNILNAARLKYELILSSIILLLSAYNGAQIGVLNGLKQFKNIAKINLFNAIISLPLFVIGAYFGVLGSVVAYALGTTILCLQTHYYIKKSEREGLIMLNLRECWVEWKILYKYSLPAALSGIMLLPVKWLSEVMLVNFSGFAAMGIFSAVMTINVLVSTVANTMTSPFISFMSSNKSDNGMIDKLNMLAPWFIVLLICVPFLCFPQLGGTFFGKDFRSNEFDESFVYVMLFTIVIMYKQGLSRIFAVKNMQWVGFISNTIWSVILIFSFFLLKEKGVVGLSISYCIAYIVVTIIMYPIYIKRSWVPMEFICSKYVIVLWTVTTILIYNTYQPLHWSFRLIEYVITMLIVLYVFYKLFKSKVNYSIVG